MCMPKRTHIHTHTHVGFLALSPHSSIVLWIIFVHSFVECRISIMSLDSVFAPAHSRGWIRWSLWVLLTQTVDHSFLNPLPLLEANMQAQDKHRQSRKPFNPVEDSVYWTLGWEESAWAPLWPQNAFMVLASSSMSCQEFFSSIEGDTKWASQAFDTSVPPLLHHNCLSHQNSLQSNLLASNFHSLIHASFRIYGFPIIVTNPRVWKAPPNLSDTNPFLSISTFNHWPLNV